MKIGIDLSIARVNQAGTGIYAQSLADSLIKLECGPQIHVFAVNQRHDMAAGKTIRSRLDTLYRDLIWMHMLLPYQVKRANIDILHMPANVVPFISKVPTAVTILDTTIMHTPQHFPRWHRSYARRFVPLAARQARIILTISEHSKRDIVTTLNVPEQKVVVTPLAAAPEFRRVRQNDVTDIKQTYKLGRFMLTVGTLEPRKNIVRLLQAFAALRKDNLDITLVHCGPKGWLFDDILFEAERLGIQDSVRFFGRVPIEDLVKLYNAADVFVYPSTYEGFGLPVLEAMACGCPVVTSQVSSLPEVAGDAAILIDPYSVGDLTAALRRVLSDPELTEQLRTRGRARAATFSWSRCAQETVAAYHRALA